MNTEPKRRGRPSGAKSLVNITLRQLNELFPLDASVPVGAIWLREYGVTVQSVAPIVVQEAEPEVEEEEKIQFSVTRFDEEKEELEAPPDEIVVDMGE
jgi:hypothetical protein